MTEEKGADSGDADMDSSSDLFPFMDEVEAALAELELKLANGAKLKPEHSSEIFELWLVNSSMSGLVHFDSRGEASNARRRLEKGADKSRRLLTELRALKRESPGTIDRLDNLVWSVFSRRFPAIDDDENELADKPVPIEWLVRTLNQILTFELKQVDEYFSEEWEARGRGADVLARKVAVSVAKTYLDLGNGQRPTFGVESHQSKPATPYTRAVDRIFKALDIKVGFRKPCKYVCDNLDALIEAGS
jgi:hypothetical protein